MERKGHREKERKKAGKGGEVNDRQWKRGRVDHQN